MPIFEARALPSDTPLAACELAVALADTAESVNETIVRAACEKTSRLR
jgi:hypothetical protein